MVLLDALKPSARLPCVSMAALPIQRQVVSGWYVLCCTKPGAPEVALLISHQRIPETELTDTLRLPTRASCPSAKRLYAERNIGLSPRPSNRLVVPSWGTQLLVVGHRLLNAAGVRLPPLVKVELAGTAKSTWNR